MSLTSPNPIIAFIRKWVPAFLIISLLLNIFLLLYHLRMNITMNQEQTVHQKTDVESKIWNVNNNQNININLSFPYLTSHVYSSSGKIIYIWHKCSKVQELTNIISSLDMFGFMNHRVIHTYANDYYLVYPAVSLAVSDKPIQTQISTTNFTTNHSMTSNVTKTMFEFLNE